MIVNLEDFCRVAGSYPEPLFQPERDIFKLLKGLGEGIARCARELPGLKETAPGVFIGEGCAIADRVTLVGPCIIGPGCQLRPGAFIRENVIIGRNSLIGNSCEIKNSILLDHVQVPHFNYVGDSLMGNGSHIGAGVILSNLKSIPGTVKVQTERGLQDTGLRKFGAIVGDRAEIGCNAVLFPGSLVGPEAIIYPLVAFRGFLPAGSIAKNRATFDIIGRRPKGYS